ncbi:hypothetical protein JXB41_07955 [Candidatus Woesearchaeota archaeon]|nr:hypothetical protein [Candidatus Woesearchaeota archaeon]
MEDIIKEQAKHDGSLLIPFLLILGGGLLIAKLLNLHSLLDNIPFEILEWTSAIGSVLGGLYMTYKKIHHTKIVI